MANEDFYIRNENNKITYNNPQNPEQKDIALNKKLMQIFKFFKKDDNEQIAPTSTSGNNELKALLSKADKSQKLSASIFNTPKAEAYIDTMEASDTTLLSEDLLQIQNAQTQQQTAPTAPPSPPSPQGSITPTAPTVSSIPALPQAPIAETEQALPENSPKTKLNLLSQIKNPDGTQRYSEQDINEIINANPNIPTKTLYAFLSASSAIYSDVSDKALIISTLQGITTDDDLKTLDLLLETDKYKIANDTVKAEPRKYDFSIHDVGIFLTNKHNGLSMTPKTEYAKQNYNQLLEKVLNSSIPNLITINTCDGVEKIVSAFQNDAQLELFDLIEQKLQLPNEGSRGSIDFFSDAYITDVMKKVSTPEDIATLKKLLDKAQTKSDTESVLYLYSDTPNPSSAEKSEFEMQIIKRLTDSDFSLSEISTIMFSLNKNNDFENFDKELFFSLIDEAKNIDATESDEAAMKRSKALDKIYIAGTLSKKSIFYEQFKKTGYIPQDAKLFERMQFKNEHQKEVLLQLLNCDGDKSETPHQFDTYEILTILSKVESKEDVETITNLLTAEGKKAPTTLDIMRALNGETVELQPLPTEEELEQAKTEVQELCKNYNNLPETYAETLSTLKLEDPDRYERLIKSGFLELVDSGKIDGEILPKANFGFPSDRTIAEIEKMSAGTPIVKTLPPSTDLSQISTHVENGKVCEHNGKLYINVDGKPVEIKLTKEKYEELFPRLITSAFNQGKLGDCYFIATVEACLDEPQSTAALLSLFEQKGNDIHITFPGMEKSIVFPDGKPLEVGDNGIKAAAPGMRILEQAYAVHRLTIAASPTIPSSDKTATNQSFSAQTPLPEPKLERAYQDSPQTNMAELTDIDTLMQRLDAGNQGDVAMDILQLAATGEATFTRPTFNGRTIEQPERPRSKVEAQKQIQKFIIENANKPGYLVFTGTDFTQNPQLCPKHAYIIKGYDENTGLVTLTNPHFTGNIIRIPIYELVSAINTVSAVNLNDEIAPVK